MTSIHSGGIACSEDTKYRASNPIHSARGENTISFYKNLNVTMIGNYGVEYS